MSELQDPKFDWKDAQTPLSQRFDDVYFSAVDGLAESRYVFVEGCGVPALMTQQDHVCIGETGFGTGLNFLLTWQAWALAGKSCRLHFISVEGFPLGLEDLAKAHETFEDLAPYAAQLQAHYPPAQAGFHHLVFEGGRVHLTLLFGLAADMLPQVDGRVDAWYLDGFAPAKNPDMWHPTVFEQMARLSRQGSVVSTFTAAGFVKRGLRDVGFEMTKRKGFGRKRDSLIGSFQGDRHPIHHPWFAIGSYKPAPKKIAVIGAGIAGCVSAMTLQGAGHEVTVFERYDHAGAQGSGNGLGLISPRLVIDQNQPVRLNTMAYLHALRFYETLQEEDVWAGARGLFQMAKDAADEIRHQRLVETGVLPLDYMTVLSRAEASDRLAHDVPRGGLWFPHAGAVRPAQICQALAHRLTVHYGQKIDALHRHAEGRWGLEGVDGAFDAVVIATAGEVARILPNCPLPLEGRTTLRWS